MSIIGKVKFMNLFFGWKMIISFFKVIVLIVSIVPIELLFFKLQIFLTSHFIFFLQKFTLQIFLFVFIRFFTSKFCKFIRSLNQRIDRQLHQFHLHCLDYI